LANIVGKKCEGEIIGQERIVPLDGTAALDGKDPICASKEGRTIESVHINSLLDGGGSDDLHCIAVYENMTLAMTPVCVMWSYSKANLANHIQHSLAPSTIGTLEDHTSPLQFPK
jgi:hypothetical protein